MGLDAAAREALITEYTEGPGRPVVEAVRANTVALLRQLAAGAWARAGRHTVSGRYTAEEWLRLYAEHLEIHARQIEQNLAEWRAALGRA